MDGDFRYSRAEGVSISKRGDRCLIIPFQHLALNRDPDHIRHSDNLGIQQNSRQKEVDTYTKGESVGVGLNLKRAFVAYGLEVACLLFAYLAYLLWNGNSITGSALSDILLLGFLSTLFALDYAIISRRPLEETDEGEAPDQPPALGTKREQALKYLKVLGKASSGQLASLLEIDVRNLSKFVNPLIQTGIIAARKEGKTFIYSLRDAHTYLHTHNRHTSLDETDYESHAELPKGHLNLPKDGNMLGRVALDDWKLSDFVYLPLRKFAQKGILVSGASGAGKTIAAKVIVEELLEDRIPVLVFDYTSQWERLLEKNTNDEMLDRYAEFGMRRNPRGFKGHIIQSAPQLDNLLNSESVTVIDLSDTCDSAERVGKVAQTLDKLLEYFQFQEDSDNLRLLIVVEEAHLWTSKEVPKDAIRFLDNAVRLLRKKGVGVMLVSQKISDFDPAMRSAMNISVLFRTKYEGDLDGISRTMGSDFSRLVPSMPVGYSVFHLADLGNPFVLAWRPTYSQP
jgi:KaiC/GvpD/RAD55 family RecA-like ATPase/DNA-binding transcriptional ArsR family regulator